MTVREPIEWLERLPKDAHAKPVRHFVGTYYGDDEFAEDPVEIEQVDYDLTTVTLS